MSDITAFIAERLDEDEAWANAGARRTGMPWRIDPEPWGGDTGIVDDLGRVGSTGGRWAADHIVRHDPARVLRDVKAGRRILTWHAQQCTCSWCDEEGDDPPVPDITGYGCPTLLMLASTWSDHPDYDAGWDLDWTCEPEGASS